MSLLPERVFVSEGLCSVRLDFHFFFAEIFGEESFPSSVFIVSRKMQVGAHEYSLTYTYKETSFLVDNIHSVNKNTEIF